MSDGPERTCLGCRRRRPKAALVRLVRRADGIVAVDPTGPGRGAYVCADAECVERALSKGRLTHAFGKPCDVRDDLLEEVRGQWQRRK